MSVDKNTVRKVARLARIAVPEERLEPLAGELNGILAWIEQPNEVNVDCVEAMTTPVASSIINTRPVASTSTSAEAEMTLLVDLASKN
mgnify:CR=1 FL=1